MSVELLITIASAVAALVAGFWTVFAVAGRQFEKRLDERFAAQEIARTEGRKLYEQRLGTLETDHRELEREFLKHLSALPKEYMRREDHIRFETVIMAKLDALGARQEMLAERLPPRRD